MRSEEFLQLYRILEGSLERRIPRESRKHTSIVRDYMDTPEAQGFREELDLCREIRNLLSHNATVDGRAVVEPSQEVLDTLRGIVEYAQKPPIAADLMTPREQLMIARMDCHVLPLMRDMQRRGFSHVPVLQDEHVTGIFSVSSVFSHAIRHPHPMIGEDTRLAVFEEYLSLEKHTSERFEFAGVHASLSEVQNLFRRDTMKPRRVAAVLVTADGTAVGGLLGMITPWDLLIVDSALAGVRAKR